VDVLSPSRPLSARVADVWQRADVRMGAAWPVLSGVPAILVMVGVYAISELLVQSDVRVKVLARGDIGKALTIRAHKFSGKAAEKIAAAGGKAEVLSQ